MIPEGILSAFIEAYPAISLLPDSCWRLGALAVD
jgi:hypothetical protein